MRNRKNCVLIFCILLVLFSFTGCTEKGVLFLPGDEEEQWEEISSNEIYLPLERIRGINPLTYQDVDAYHISRLVLEGLVKLDDTLTAEPSLAESWNYAPDRSSLIFHLRREVKWQDGTAFTAQDVKASIDAYLKAAKLMPPIYAEQLRSVKECRVLSDQEVELIFTNKDSIAVENFTVPILSKKQLDTLKNPAQTDPAWIVIGTGPYRIETLDPLTQVVLAPHSEYYGEQKANNRLIFQVIPNHEDALSLFDISQINMAIFTGLDTGTLYSNKDLSNQSFLSNEVEVLGFQCTSPLLQDKKVRQAISCAIDLNEIIEVAYYHNGVMNDTIYYPDYLTPAKGEYAQAPDLAKAKRLLTEAGFINRDSDERLEDSLGNELVLEILVNSGDRSRNLAAQIIQKGLDNLQVDSVIIVEDWSAYQARIAAGNYDVFVGGWTIHPLYDLRSMLHSKAANPAKYANPEMDFLLDQMQSGIQGEERLSTYLKIKEVLKEDTPYLSLLYKTYTRVNTASLQGNWDPSFFSFYQGAEQLSNLYRVPAKK